MPPAVPAGRHFHFQALAPVNPELRTWIRGAERTLAATRILDLKQVEYRHPDRPAGREFVVVSAPDWVNVAALTPAGELVLVRQFRFGIDAFSLEIPGGVIEPGEDPVAAGIRELREETGYQLPPGGELIPMGSFFSSPGFTDEHSYLFLARGVIPSPGGPRPEASEAIQECRPFTVAELRRMIAENEVRDANTLSAFARMTALELI